jgi:hypothetical protein
VVCDYQPKYLTIYFYWLYQTFLKINESYVSFNIKFTMFLYQKFYSKIFITAWTPFSKVILFFSEDVIMSKRVLTLRKKFELLYMSVNSFWPRQLDQTAENSLKYWSYLEEQRLIRKLYMQQRAKLHLNKRETNNVEIGRWVREDCCTY